MIKLQVIGHLGKDATVNTLQSGDKVINFSVCHTEKFKDSTGAQKEKSTWVECAKWGEQIGVAQYLKKGGQVYVEGTPEIKTYSKADGTQGVSLALRVFSLQLLGGGTGGGTQQAGQSEQQPAAQPATASANGYKPVETGTTSGGPDDLPF